MRAISSASFVLTGVLALCLRVIPAAADSPPDVDALAKQGAETLLRALDARHNHHPTQIWTFKMTVQPKGGDPRTLKFRVWQKGTKRLVRFLEPGEVKGMSVLSKGPQKMWVYSQETGGKARLVASSARRQALLGSDLSFDDMSTVDLSLGWNATLGKDEGASRWLILTPRPDLRTSWKKLRLRVNKKTAMIDRLEYFDDTLVKVQDRTRFGVVDGAPVYQTITMTTVATGHQTTLDMLDQQIGRDLPNRTFSKRSLIRGN